MAAARRRSFAITCKHVGCANERANRAKPRRAHIAGMAFQSVDRYGFRAAQPATTIGNEGAPIDKYSLN